MSPKRKKAVVSDTRTDTIERLAKYFSRRWGTIRGCREMITAAYDQGVMDGYEIGYEKGVDSTYENTPDI